MLDNLYDDYPVQLTEVDMARFTRVQPTEINTELLDKAHLIVYDFLIYATYNSGIKTRIIEKYIDVLEKPLARALVEQYQYLIVNGGDIGDWNGIIRVGQTVDCKEVQELLTKIVALKVINILKGAPIDLLYTGG